MVMLQLKSSDGVVFEIDEKVRGHTLLKLFFIWIHFELARLAAGTTVDILHAPIDYFRRF